MKNFTSALHSEYILDGIPQELTPAEILNEVSIEKLSSLEQTEPITDETLDPDFKSCPLSAEHMHYYASKVLNCRRDNFPILFAESYTKSLISWALIDTLWKDGHFRLRDLVLDAKWNWSTSGMGSLAAFYASCAATAEFIDALGIRLQRYSATEAGHSSLEFTPCISRFALEEEDILGTASEQSCDPEMGASLKTSPQFVPDPDSWIIYVPFDTCDYRLGGSLLSVAMNRCAEVAPETGDADYFIDCYELVRELSEDGILLSAGTVGQGGLLPSLKQMCGSCGAKVNISDIKSSTHERDAIRLLFAEVPGAIIQIKDIDFDYIDAEMLLQDVVYFPLGHPDVSTTDITVIDTGKSNIESILDSLIRSQSSEGED